MIAELGIDRSSATPLAMQLSEQIRQAVLTGRMKPRTRLPSTRMLAAELGLSRATILTAFEQLIAEGYLEGRHGSGTSVVANLPDQLLKSVAAPLVVPTRRPTWQAPRPFQLGLFDSANFPHQDWGKTLGRIWQNPPAALLHHQDPFGYLPLREAIARHLHSWRGMEVKPEQIVVTAGGTDALSLIREALFKPGDTFWFEEPGYQSAKQLLGRNGVTAISVPVDGAGLTVDAAIALAPRAKAAFVTPARHYPTGVTMPLARRLQLIDWAQQSDGFIIEDDYESEHRYVGQPLPALMTLAPDRVLYIGTFSKAFSPLVRLGFLIIPPDFISRIQALRQDLLSAPSLLAQPALATFMENGAFAQHIRRMRRIHAARRSLLIAELAAGEPQLFQIKAPPAGLSLLLAFPDGTDDVADAERLRQAGIDCEALSPLYPTLPAKSGLLLGFSAFDEKQLTEAARSLLEVLRRAR